METSISSATPNTGCISLGASSQLDLKEVNMTNCGSREMETIGGGAVKAGDFSEIIMENVLFTNNSADSNNGGSISVGNNSVVTITDAVFTENIAQNGGAIWGGVNVTISLTNVLLESNVADLQGGAIYKERFHIQNP